MNLLVDENQHPVVIARLRQAGYQVEAVKETSAGSDDVDILARPDIATLVLITYDRDFSDLIFNQRYPAPWAVLYLRLSRADPHHVADRLLALLAVGVAPRHITTITKDGERLKPFPVGVPNA